jgi:NodT family efflux transporter outer membrane factor (OMF) lipoprotein
MDPIPSLPPLRRALALVAGAVFAGCAAGPNYQRPAVATPAAFKEAAGWKLAAPTEEDGRRAWWEIFRDPTLNALETQLVQSNLSLAKADADYEQARQEARADETALWPEIAAAASAQRAQSAVKPAANVYAASLAATWSLDLWGKTRRGVEAAVALAQAEAAAADAARLTLEQTLAQDYIALRILDAKERLIGDAVVAYRRTLTISQNRYSVGVVARSDVISAQAQLDSTRARWLDTGIQRAQFEHAIATLVATAPAAYTLAPLADFTLAAPGVPARLPSELLERRPDVAQAEREMAAANALVGVQTAAYFPQLTLSAQGGFEGSPVRELLTTPFRFWSLGGQVSDALLDWGERHDQVLAARAAYAASVANYRSAVLTAFQQVEDNLASLRILGAEGQVEDAAVTEAAEAARIALNEYSSGTVDYTTVASAQVTELADREAALAILQARLAATVDFIAALGGGWNARELASSHQVLARDGATPVPTAEVALAMLQKPADLGATTP